MYPQSIKLLCSNFTVFTVKSGLFHSPVGHLANSHLLWMQEFHHWIWSYSEHLRPIVHISLPNLIFLCLFNAGFLAEMHPFNSYFQRRRLVISTNTKLDKLHLYVTCLAVFCCPNLFLYFPMLQLFEGWPQVKDKCFCFVLFLISTCLIFLDNKHIAFKSFFLKAECFYFMLSI